jgi:hypothetical protein
MLLASSKETRSKRRENELATSLCIVTRIKDTIETEKSLKKGPSSNIWGRQ